MPVGNQTSNKSVDFQPELQVDTTFMAGNLQFAPVTPRCATAFFPCLTGLAGLGSQQLLNLLAAILWSQLSHCMSHCMSYCVSHWMSHWMSDLGSWSSLCGSGLLAGPPEALCPEKTEHCQILPGCVVAIQLEGGNEMELTQYEHCLPRNVLKSHPPLSQKLRTSLGCPYKLREEKAPKFIDTGTSKSRPGHLASSKVRQPAHAATT